MVVVRVHEPVGIYVVLALQMRKALNEKNPGRWAAHTVFTVRNGVWHTLILCGALGLGKEDGGST